jgi:hypothetical protein
MFEYQFWLAILGVLIAAYTAYLQRKQIMMAIESASPNTGAKPPSSLVWWKSPAIILLFLLVCVNWGPFILSKIHEEDRVRGGGGIRAATIDNSTGKYVDFTLYVSINGEDIYQYSLSWRVIAAGFVWTVDIDHDDIQDIHKSASLEIRNEPMVFMIKTDHKFVDQVNKGAPINYCLIILPKKVTPDSFKTLRQAKDLGAKVITMGSTGF